MKTSTPQTKMCRVKFLLFLLPLLSHLLLTVAVSTSDDGGPPGILLPRTRPTREHGKVRQYPLISFFWHDTSGGQDPSAVIVAQSATTTSSTNFGRIRVMDDPITIGPDRSSQLIGKSQGIYVSADKTTPALFMAMTFIFSSGKYAGSSLAVVGRNELRKTEREMPITGGTGLLQYAKGYVLIRTIYSESTNGYTVLEYNCYFNTLPFNSSAGEY